MTNLILQFQSPTFSFMNDIDSLLSLEAALEEKESGKRELLEAVQAVEDKLVASTQENSQLQVTKIRKSWTRGFTTEFCRFKLRSLR